MATKSFARRSIADSFPQQQASQPSGWADDAPAETSSPAASSPADVLSGLRVADRKRDNRVRTPVVSYRGVPKALMTRLKSVAARHGVPAGELARYLMEIGLSAHHNGTQPIVSELAGKYTLYPPESSQWNAKPVPPAQIHKKAKKKKPGFMDDEAEKVEIAAFRGLPQSLRDDIEKTAASLLVSNGEVARKLLETGLDAVQSGAITLPVYQVVKSVGRSLYDA